LRTTPTLQSPIPNPQSPIFNSKNYSYKTENIINLNLLINNI